MLGGFLAAAFMSWLGLPFLLAAVLAIAGAALFALPLEALLIRHIYRRSELDQALLTIGIAFVVIALINLLSGVSITVVPLPDWLAGPVDLGVRTLPKHRLAVIGVGIAVIAALRFGIERSAFGIRLRAAVDNPGIAEAVGINTRVLYSASFAIGAALAALGGIAGAELLPMEPTYAIKYLVLFLAVVAVGGHGTLLGSFIAALLLGIMDTAAKYLVPDLSSIAFFLTMVVVLAVRPQGLLGKA
jgi:branched-chain amino acid transport system permease protein